ncbi:GAF domain-containing sensor histidine kinase [Pedobacter sandarakinus]|uniref:GAF domain-containing sensor histidine kinase n=1 Tax=Pedobacter sandarakinus TaxID=353156 RepID=UPI002245DFA4|nr:GAF domain-containing sensor histidine kinase [Pedobacter sandarakinus]MCX2574528.1 GAF domain-containing sensor histidine kinase [Pedobacter sandarakinus]
MQNHQLNSFSQIESISKVPAIANILEIVCNTTGMGFAAVAKVTSSNWTACIVNDRIEFGLKPGDELPLETTICNEIRQHQNPVLIEHVAEDELFSRHHTPERYGFQSYISVPIVLKSGEFFGTLCAIDPKPAKLNNGSTLETFKLFAELIAFHIDSMEELSAVENKLQYQIELADFREQFIAILGHDLKNPLNAVANSAQLLDRINQDERTHKLVKIIRDSSFRMNGLIENMLDFASGRLGGGISVERTADEDLEVFLIQVVDEIKAIFPDRQIDTSFKLHHPVISDGKRIAQLFSNLLGNAMNYSTPGTAIEVIANSTADGFTLSVTNDGKQISPIVMKHLFQPFSRGAVAPNQKGLGLGLYISAQIAEAHGGKLNVTSEGNRTCFTLTLPSI